MNNMMQYLRIWLLLVFFMPPASGLASGIRVLVVTGGHDYDTAAFRAMFESMEDVISFEIAELPDAFIRFEPERRDAHDVVVMYHMWQDIATEQANNIADCIGKGKPLVVLHHSICAFDDWDEYRHIVGGKYFHRPDTIDGHIYKASSYEHGVKVPVHVHDPAHPVTRGMKDFTVIDETYDDYYVDPGVIPLLTTDHPGSTPVIGWTKEYGRARVVTLQSGHDGQAFGDASFRKILRQAIIWVFDKQRGT